VRRRIVGLTVLAAVLATCLFGIPLGIAATRYYVGDERNELERMADTAALAVSGDVTRAGQASVLPHLEHGTEVSVYDQAGALVTGRASHRAGGLVGRTLRGAVASGDVGGRLAVAVPISDGDTVVGAVLATTDRAQVYRRIGASWLGMLALAVVAVAVSWLVARRQAQRLARPLEQLCITAERLGGGDFSVRTQPAGIAEIDTVNASLDRTAERLGSLVERERAFSADASHQLRTPLTGLQLGMEAALAAPDADLRGALRAALDAAQRLDTTVADLLALARDVPADGQPLDVDAFLNGIRARWNGPLARADRPLRIALERPLPGTTMSSAAAEQILDVLLDNALRHGAGAVTVTVRDAEDALAVDVSDEGGPLRADPQQLFRRRSAAGDGIGLALARRLAESEGGRLVLSSASAPRFTLFAPLPR
jgi:signal transduction histidine kinase